MKNFPKKIKINQYIHLELMSFDHKNQYFDSIHKDIHDNDYFRLRLKKKYPEIIKIYLLLKHVINNKFSQNGSPDYFIFYKYELVGMFEFHPIIKSVNFLEIGYWLYKDFRRKGILSSIIPVMIEFAKSYFDKIKVLATTSINNSASQKLLKKMNFMKTNRILEFTDKNTGVVSKEFEYFYFLKNIKV